MGWSFHFAKTYADVVDEAGNWWIGYDAQLSWGPIRLNYREVGGGASRAASRLRFGSRELNGDDLVVDGVALRLSGGRRKCSKSLGYRSEVLEWRLNHAGADVRISDDGGTRDLPSAGYGETVVLHAPPWELGIRELHWGRYLSPTQFVTWIVADGERPIRFGVTDVKTSYAEVSHEGRVIQVGPHRIELGNKVTQIADDNPLSSRTWPIERIAKWLAPNFSLTQQKAAYRAQVTNSDGSCEDGLVIAERVIFTH